jgi:NADPH:quinone reductase-like Zn-dependent oxidoreductase
MLIMGVYGVRPELPAALGAEGVGRGIAAGEGEGVDVARLGERVVVVPTLEHATWREQTIVADRHAVPVDADGDPLQLAMLGIDVPAPGVPRGDRPRRPGRTQRQGPLLIRALRSTR